MAQYIKPSGARVALVRLPLLSLSPLGQAASEADREALRQLIVAFNDGVTNQAEVDFDGRQLTLVRTDTLTQQMFDSRTRSSYGISNSTDVGCASGRGTTAPLCNTSYADPTASQGVVNSTVSSVYLWADATHFAPQAHARLAALVVSNVTRNPL
jgi:phospholipase/lecithinase/hemolysin